MDDDDDFADQACDTRVPAARVAELESLLEDALRTASAGDIIRGEFVPRPARTAGERGSEKPQVHVGCGPVPLVTARIPRLVLSADTLLVPDLAAWSAPFTPSSPTTTVRPTVVVLVIEPLADATTRMAVYSEHGIDDIFAFDASSGLILHATRKEGFREHRAPIAIPLVRGAVAGFGDTSDADLLRAAIQAGRDSGYAPPGAIDKLLARIRGRTESRREKGH